MFKDVKYKFKGDKHMFKDDKHMFKDAEYKIIRIEKKHKSYLTL